MEKHNHSSYGGAAGAIETHTMNAFIQSPFMQWVSDIQDILTQGFTKIIPNSNPDVK